MPKGDAKDGYLNTNAHLEAKVALLERDLDEQCRLLGMGSEREARLMAQLAESQARELRLREAMRPFADGDIPDDDAPENYYANTKNAYEAPQDDSALREMIEAAKAEEREMCAKACDSLVPRSDEFSDEIERAESRTARDCAAAIRARKG